MELREVPAREAHVDGINAERFLIEANRQRVKTKVQRLQEYKRLKEIETSLAKERQQEQLKRGKDSPVRANLPQRENGKARVVLPLASECSGFLRPPSVVKFQVILRRFHQFVVNAIEHL
jgi:hypothetical protein